MEFPRANTLNFPLFFRLLDQNSEEYEAHSYSMLNSEHIPVNLRESLIVLNPDFTGVIQKSGISSAIYERVLDRIVPREKNSRGKQ